MMDSNNPNPNPNLNPNPNPNPNAILVCRHEATKTTAFVTLTLTLRAPLAKAFGALIDLNSSLLLIPVCRTIIRLEHTVKDRSWDY